MSLCLRRSLGAACAVGVAAGLGAGPAAAQPPPPGAAVLVRVDAGAGPAERAQVARALDAEAVRPLMAGWRAYRLEEPLTLAQARARLAGAEAAGGVQLDGLLQPYATANDQYRSFQWPLDAIDAGLGWDLAAGAAQVVVAVIDEGVDTAHPDLAGKLWTNPGEIAGNGLDDDADGLVDDREGWNFADDNSDVYDPADGDEHGTHVAGTIAAVRNNSIGVAGVADNARIMPLKFLTPEGGFTSDAIAAIGYAVAHGARVINASWGGDSYSPALCDAVAQAGAAGVLFVTAAGNDGTDNDQSARWPASCPAASLVSVAATTIPPFEGLAGFSNRGAVQVDVGAPGGSGNPPAGDNVISTIPGSQYGYMAGTSMAAPHVSAIAAAAIGKHPGRALWEIRAAIVLGGDPLGALAATTAYGRRADLAGTLTALASGAGLDPLAPTAFTPLSPGAGAITALATPTFSWSPSSDDLSGLSLYRVLVDGAVVASVPAGTGSATPAAPLAEGVRSWEVVAVDAVGNQRSSGARALTVDRTAPTVPALSSPARGALVGSSVSLRWAAAQDATTGVAGYRVEVDGAVAASVGPGVRSARLVLRRGAHRWRAFAVDGAGNEKAGPSRQLFVDRVRLHAPSTVVSGARPVLRVRVAARARVSFLLRRAGERVTRARFARSLPAGESSVRMPGSVARALRAPGVYLLTAQAPPSPRATARLTVTPARR